MCCVKQSMLPSSLRRELGLSPFGNYWWRRKPHSLLHIHVDEGKQYLWLMLGDQMLRGISLLGLWEKLKPRSTAKEAWGPGKGRDTREIYPIFCVFYFFDTWLYGAVYDGWLFCGQHSGTAWKTHKKVTYENQKEEALCIICSKEMLYAQVHLFKANLLPRKSFL